nr:uncharacterized protein LOC121118270 [Lepeophtheirus salmonis]
MNKIFLVCILFGLQSLSFVVSKYSGLYKISSRVPNRGYKDKESSPWRFQYPPFSNTSLPPLKKRKPRPIRLHRHDEFLPHLIQNFESIHDLNRLQLSGEKNPGGHIQKNIPTEPIPWKYVAPRIGF